MKQWIRLTNHWGLMMSGTTLYVDVVTSGESRKADLREYLGSDFAWVWEVWWEDLSPLEQLAASADENSELQEQSRRRSV